MFNNDNELTITDNEITITNVAKTIIKNINVFKKENILIDT